jgi:hypothetical protein
VDKPVKQNEQRRTTKMRSAVDGSSQRTHAAD